MQEYSSSSWMRVHKKHESRRSASDKCRALCTCKAKHAVIYRHLGENERLTRYDNLVAINCLTRKSATEMDLGILCSKCRGQAVASMSVVYHSNGGLVNKTRPNFIPLFRYSAFYRFLLCAPLHLMHKFVKNKTKHVKLYDAYREV